MVDRWLVLDQHLTIIEVPPEVADDPFYKSIIGLNIRDAEPPVGEELIRCYETAFEIGCAACMTEYPAGSLVHVRARREGDVLHVTYASIRPDDLHGIIDRWQLRARLGDRRVPSSAAQGNGSARHLKRVV